MRFLSGQPRRFLRFLMGAAGLSLGLFAAAALVLKVKRPEILSPGSIGFALGLLSIPVFLIVFVSGLRKEPDSEGFRPAWLDIFFAASVALSLASFLVASRSRENFLQPYMLITAFAAYLLVRTNRRRLQGAPVLLLARALAALAGIEAAHGLVQWAAGREMKGFFYNVNHFAMFLAMVLPVAWVLAKIGKNPFLRLSGYGVNALLFAAVGLSRCRTAYTALLLVGGIAFLLRRLPSPASEGPGSHRARRSAVRGALVLGATGLVVIAALAVSFKPMSAAGRILIWKVSLGTALTHPVAGVGYGNFPAVYNAEQGRYFEEGRGTAIERLSASTDAYAFNDYLESFMESGVLGLLVLLPFWGLILRASTGVFRRPGPRSPGRVSSSDEALTFGASGSVLAYMGMAVFYYPSRILPMALLFSLFLGWLAGGEWPVPGVSRRSAKGGVLAFAAVSFAAALLLMPTLWKRYIADREWLEALSLSRAGRNGEALAHASAAYPHLKFDPVLIELYADLLLDSGEFRDAAAILERSKVSSFNPRIAEKLAIARLGLGELEAALKEAREADAVLPWRLTSKAILAEIHRQRGDVEAACRYARKVIDTPMKVRTAEGETLKTKAFALWAECGKQAGDDGRPILDLLGGLPPDYRGAVLGALQAMGSRSGPFIEMLQAAGPDERTGLAFLLANMPDRDVRTLDADYLAENIRLACLARRTVPLASGIPEDIFLEYVLPYAAADEPRDAWRADFYERFREAVASSSSVDEAVVRLNQEIIMQFRLVYADKHVRKPLFSPRQIIERGLVSCGEASLLLVDACRSVGIPARMAVLPRYRGRRGGHIWVEVWDRDRWRHIAAYDLAYLDRTWILPYIQKMFPPGSRGVVFAPRFSRTGLRAMPGRDINFVDISENYFQ
jgi:O-antigen ligase/tetratricopeptide (TPR) repeat protein